MIWVLWPIKIISLILRRVNHNVGEKWETPEKKRPDHPQAELGLSQMRWDDKQLIGLKISILNHSATEYKHHVQKNGQTYERSMALSNLPKTIQRSQHHMRGVKGMYVVWSKCILLFYNRWVSEMSMIYD